MRGCPRHRLVDLTEVALVDDAPLGLEQRPVHDEAHAVEADGGHLGEVVLGERHGGRQDGVDGGLVVVAELVRIDAAKQNLAVLGVLDAW